MVRPLPSFEVWARDHGVELRVEAAAQKLTTSGPVYRRITKGAYCLADLTPVPRLTAATSSLPPIVAVTSDGRSASHR